MANSNEELTKTPKAAENAAEQEKLAVKKPKKGNTPQLPLLPTLILTISIASIALASALYAIYAHLQSQQHKNQQIQKLSAELANLQEQQLTAKKSLTETAESVSHSQATLQSQMQDLSKNLQSALQQHHYQNKDWLLLKARYYLQLAQINAHWSNEQQTTIALLQQADSLLLTIPDEHLFAVRQAIAKEIAQLKAIPQIDITGLLSQLVAAQDTISDLPVKQPFIPTLASSEKNTEQKTSPAWKEKLQESMNVLAKLVVVRRNDENIQPMLSPLQQNLLRAGLRLHLQQAEWAILQNNTGVYQLSLARAIIEIKRNFDTNATATQALIKQLQALQQEKLSITKPVIDESLNLLNQWIESKNFQTNDNTAPKAGDKTP
jgi:uroporphyrin-III C-methyltransferase